MLRFKSTDHPKGDFLQIIQICEIVISLVHIHVILFLKGIMIVHEIKLKNMIFNVIFLIYHLL